MSIKQSVQTVEELQLEMVFRNSPDAITITRLSNGEIIEGNESVYTLLGYTHGEVVGKTTLELGIWADPAERLKYYLSFLREKLLAPSLSTQPNLIHSRKTKYPFLPILLTILPMEFLISDWENLKGRL